MTLLPKLSRMLRDVGENIKLARLRRKLTMEQVAQRAGISRSTLSNIEQGAPSTSIESLIKVLKTLGLEEDIFNIAKNDVVGRKLQDIELLNRKRYKTNE